MTKGTDIKGLFDEAVPLVRAALELTEKFTKLREAATAKELEWSQIKALAKASIQDEADSGKRVRALLDRSDAITGYADLLGLSEKKNNFSSPNESRGSTESRRVPHLVGEDNRIWDGQAINVARRDGQESENGHRQRNASLTASESNEAASGAVRGALAPEPPISAGRSGDDRRISPKEVTDPSSGGLSDPERRAKALGPHSERAGVAPGPRDTNEGRSVATLGQEARCAPATAELGTAEVPAVTVPSISDDPNSIPESLRRRPNDPVWRQ